MAAGREHDENKIYGCFMVPLDWHPFRATERRRPGTVDAKVVANLMALATRVLACTPSAEARGLAERS